MIVSCIKAKGNKYSYIPHIPHTDVLVSVPATESVTEGEETVQVCAELSIESAVPIIITLATSDGMYVNI